jgi:tetratricopeptide (TPR) repeat protein
MLVRIIVAALALLSFAGVAHAGDKVKYQPAPAWVLAAPPIDPAAMNGSSSIFVRLDQQQRISPDGQVWGYMDMATRMASPQMLTSAGNLTLPWSPEKGDLIIHSVEILRGGERIDVLKSKQRFTVLRREQMLEQGFMSGLLTATLPVEGLRLGDVLRVSFSITSKDPVLGSYTQTMLPVMPDTLKLGYGRIRLLWPSGMDVRWHAFAKDPSVQVTESGGWKELLLTLPLPKQPEVPGDAPMRFQRPPLLEVTNFNGWASVVHQMGPLFRADGLIKPGTPLDAEVKKIAAATQDPRIRTAMALRLVQDKVRYLFKGMDEGNYVPQAPAETWKLRYGDCKAKSLLLVAMLRALGIEADAALTSATAGDLLPQRLPMPGAFDHVIARAVVGGETLWLDGTANDTRLADLSDVPPFRYALPLKDGVTDLVPLPVKPTARPDQDVTVEIDQRAGIGFTAPFTLTAKMRGGMVGMLRMMAPSMGAEQSDQMIDLMLTPYVFGGTIVERTMSFDEESGVTTFTASGFVDMAWSNEGKGLRYKLVLDTWLEGRDFSPDRARAVWKDIPVSTGEVSNRRLRIVLRLPDKGQGFALEGDQVLPPLVAGMQVKRNSALSDGVVTIEDHVITGVGEIAPADLPAARQQVAGAKTRLLKASSPPDYPATWQVVDDAIEAKAFDPLLAIFARYIALKPDDATRYIYRAGFLQTIYDRKGALADYDKAIELAPSAEIHVARSSLRDALGDGKGALEDARAAFDLDPGSAWVVGTLANALARNGELDEALSLLTERIDAGGKDKNGYVQAKASILANAGRAAEGIALLDTAIAESPREASLLNSRCWIKGTAKIDLPGALKDCQASIQLSQAPSHVIDSLGMVLYRMGQPGAAQESFDEALKWDPYVVGSHYMRGVIRLERGDRGGIDDLAVARRLDPQVDRDYARDGIKPKE